MIQKHLAFFGVLLSLTVGEAFGLGTRVGMSAVRAFNSLRRASTSYARPFMCLYKSSWQKPAFLHVRAAFTTNTNTDQKLLSRLEHAQRQGDQATVASTLAFIKERRPALLSQALEILKSKKVNDQEEYDKSASSDDRFWQDGMKNLRNKLRELTEAKKKLRLLIQAMFEARARDVRIALHEVTQPPRKTWWEFLTRKDDAYRDRLFAWVFDDRHTFFGTLCDLTPQDKATFFALCKTIVDARCAAGGWDHKRALAELKNEISEWNPLAGYAYEHPEAIQKCMGLFGDAYIQAIKNHHVLSKVIAKYGAHLEKHPEACRAIYRHIHRLTNAYQARLLLWLAEFSKKY